MVAIVKAAKANVGKDTPKMEEMNKVGKRKDSSAYKVTATGRECDSGTTDAELSSKAGSIYSGAVSNSGMGGDKALQNR